MAKVAVYGNKSVKVPEKCVILPSGDKEYYYGDGTIRLQVYNPLHDEGIEDDDEDWPVFDECVICERCLPHGKADHRCNITVLEDEGYGGKADFIFFKGDRAKQEEVHSGWYTSKPSIPDQ